MIAHVVLWLLAACGCVTGKSITVALSQMWSVPDIEANTAKIVANIEAAAQAHADLVAFPECAISSYNSSYIQSLTREQLSFAEARIAAACSRFKIHAVVGAPGYYTPGDRGYTNESKDKRFNQALVFDDFGRTIYRYSKIGLAGWDGHGDSEWAAPGREISIFNVAGVNMSIIICHDMRFPELVRLPVMAGSRVVVFISDEWSGPSMRDNYKTQAQGRAEENQVWVLHVNTPYTTTCTPNDSVCSHGQSLFADPNGNTANYPIGSVTDEQLLVSSIDVGQSEATCALESLRQDYMTSHWWRQAVAEVGVVNISRSQVLL